MTARKFWIAVFCVLIPIAVHGAWDQIEATRMSRAVREIQAGGAPINTSELRRPLDSDEQREAARLYFAAAVLAAPKFPPALRPESAGGQAWAKVVSSLTAVVQAPPSRVADDPRVADLQATVDSTKPALMLLDLATPLDFRKFGPERPGYSYFPADLMQLGAIASLRTDLLSLRRDASAAAAHLDSVRLLRTFTGTIGLFVPRTSGSLALLLERVVPEDAALLGLQRAYEARADLNPLIDGLYDQRALLLDTIWPHTYGRSSWVQRLRPGGAPGMSRPQESLGFTLLRPWLTHRSIDELRRYEDDIRIARLPLPQRLVATKSARDSGDPSHRFSAGNVLIAARNLAADRVAVATLATERFRRAHGGAPPSSLSALVPDYLRGVPLDPFSGGELHFVQDPGGYAIYSVGVNQKDDGGKLPPWEPDITYRRSATDAAVDLGIRVPLHPLQ
jgi:hypothetical protein